MSGSEIEARLLQQIEALTKEVQALKAPESPRIPVYQYSKIRDRDLNALFRIERNLDPQRFDDWFNTPLIIDPATEGYLTELLADNQLLIDTYGEEDLKINFIAPLLQKVRFKSFEQKIRDFYEVSMTYTTANFILTGSVDFVVAEGLVESKKPYFFIQEFKRSEEYGNPRPQLLAELISALELNQWRVIKGAYIIGGSWHFVILEKLAADTYQYVVSRNFDSTKIDDLTLIYKHLVAVKQEIFSLRNAEIT